MIHLVLRFDDCNRYNSTHGNLFVVVRRNSFFHFNNFVISKHDSHLVQQFCQECSSNYFYVHSNRHCYFQEHLVHKNLDNERLKHFC